MKKFRSWTIYGDWFQHPNGYPIKSHKVLSFESGPDLNKDEKVVVVEKAALDSAMQEMDKLRETLKEYATGCRVNNCYDEGYLAKKTLKSHAKWREEFGGQGE